MSDSVKKIKQKYESQWLALDKVVSVGVGLSDENRPAIIVSVTGIDQKIKEQIPDKIGDVDVIIKLTDGYRAL